jgi:hypothetical protein
MSRTVVVDPVEPLVTLTFDRRKIDYVGGWPHGMRFNSHSRIVDEPGATFGAFICLITQVEVKAARVSHRTSNREQLTRALDSCVR